MCSPGFTRPARLPGSKPLDPRRSLRSQLTGFNNRMSNTTSPAQRLALGLVALDAFLPGPDTDGRRLLREVGSLVQKGYVDAAFMLSIEAGQKATDRGSFEPEICLLAGFVALIAADGHL